MKRQISICIFLALIVIVLALLYIKLHNESGKRERPQTESTTPSETENNTGSITSSYEYKTYYFYAKEENGHILIYDIKTQTLYMETGIETNALPEHIQVELKSGIYFENEEQLYSFLESYSS